MKRKANLKLLTTGFLLFSSQIALAEDSHKLTLFSDLLKQARAFITEDAAPTIGVLSVLMAVIFFFRRSGGAGVMFLGIAAIAFAFDGVITMFRGLLGQSGG